MEVLINSTYGGCSLSDKALELYNQRCKERDLSPMMNRFLDDNAGERCNPLLLEIVRELGSDANGTWNR